jgi:hypothetical protein
VPALLVAGSLAVAATLGVLVALEREVRAEALGLLRSRRSIGGWPTESDPAEAHREA